MKAVLTYVNKKIDLPNFSGNERQTPTDEAICHLLDNYPVAMKDMKVFNAEGRMTFNGYVTEEGKSFAGRNLGGAVVWYNHRTGEETKTPMNPGPF